MRVGLSLVEIVESEIVAAERKLLDPVEIFQAFIDYLLVFLGIAFMLGVRQYVDIVYKGCRERVLADEFTQVLPGYVLVRRMHGNSFRDESVGLGERESLDWMVFRVFFRKCLHYRDLGDPAIFSVELEHKPQYDAHMLGLEPPSVVYVGERFRPFPVGKNLLQQKFLHRI